MSDESFVIRIPPRHSPAGKVFTHPTRLVETWKPGLMEFWLPEDAQKAQDIEVARRPGTTRDLGYHPSRSRTGLYQIYTRPLEMGADVVYDARYELDTNIAHILSTVVPEILICRQRYPGLKVILREKATAMARNAYAALGIPVVCTNRAVKAQVLGFTSSWGERLNSAGRYESMYVELFRERSFEGYTADTPERVYISRKGERSLLNEDEVHGLLRDFGFQRFYFEDIPIGTQWSVTRNARLIVGIHGAALASLIFARPDFKLVELFHPGYVVNMYRNITARMGGRWVGVTGQLTPEVIQKLDFEQQGRAFATAPTRIDLASLRKALEYIEIAKP